MKYGLRNKFVDVFLQKSGVMDMSLNPSMLMDQSSSKSDSLGTDGLTGKVGTALYVSPEMMDTNHRTHYNQVCVCGKGWGGWWWEQLCM